MIRAGARSVSLIALSLAALTAVAFTLPRVGQFVVLRGAVVTEDGGPAPGALITARRPGGGVAWTVVADGEGRFRLEGLPAGPLDLMAHGPGYGADGPRTIEGVAGVLAFRLQRAAPKSLNGPSSTLLGMLPPGEEKRRFVRDCTGCHVLDARIAFPGGQPRSRADWQDWTGRMLGLAGPASGFPVIGMRTAEETAAYLARHLTADALPSSPAAAPAHAAGAVITEYDIPEPGDLPHDVAVLGDGRVLITGMFTHRMYLLDPETAEFTTEPIPQANANPRAVELGADGSWWVVLGGPQRLARRTPDGEWRTWHVGVYPHSLGIAPDGRVWYNGHFTRSPEVVGVVDATTGEVTRFEVPPHPEADRGAGPIPYELRVAADGRVWGTELLGDRVFALDPASGRFQIWRMPDPHSAPRRLDIAADGSVWIPEYAGGGLTRLDPGTGEMRRYALPIEDAAPYVARVDARSGRVWVGTGAADAIFAFDPTEERWTTYPLPSRGALVRHLAVDGRNGDLWIAYGASPGAPAKVARLRVGATAMERPAARPSGPSRPVDSRRERD